MMRGLLAAPLALALSLSAGRADAQLVGHAGIVNGVAVSPDGRQVLSASWDYSVRLWDLAAQKELKVLEGHAANVNAVRFLPDGRSGISASWDGTIKLWDLASGAEIRTLKGHAANVSSIAVTRDGRMAASGKLGPHGATVGHRSRKRAQGPQRPSRQCHGGRLSARRQDRRVGRL